jgi:antitoxin (DNA-binding transcriptional repressor) of toxin-antitoxin stability system
MATRIGIRELRDGLTGILRRVEAGEPVQVTRDDVVIAVLSPASGSALDIMLASGEAIPSVPLDTPIRTRPPRSGIRASDVLQDDRDR